MKVDAVLKNVVDAFKSQAYQKSDSEMPAEPEGETECPPPPNCGFCEEQPATRRCMQCDGFLCQDCEKSTHAKGYFKSHNIVDLGEESPDALDFASRMICNEHSEKLDFYCIDCRTPVCSHCLILGDHQKHQQTPLDQAYQTGKETLGAWAERMSQRITLTEELLESFRSAEQDIQRNAESQRGIVNNELDHLRELIETKRHQLLSKCALEEKQKRLQLQAQLDRTEVSRGEAKGLVSRSENLLSLTSEHAFLSTVLPLIQDMKKCAARPVDDGQRVATAFRPLSTDPQVRSLGDLDLGHPRASQAMNLVQPMVSAQTGMHGQTVSAHACMDSSHHSGSFAVMQQPQAVYGTSGGAMQYAAPQPGVIQSQQVQYVYRSVPPG